MRAQTATAVEEHRRGNDVKVDLEHGRVLVTFDARKMDVPDLHDAILKSGYKPVLMADWTRLFVGLRHYCARRR